MSLTTEFERSYSARLNSGLQVLDNRLSETLDTSVSTCRGHDQALTVSQEKMWRRFSLIERGLISSMNASNHPTISLLVLIM